MGYTRKVRYLTSNNTKIAMKQMKWLIIAKLFLPYFLNHKPEENNEPWPVEEGFIVQ